jgi:formiminotetrahydrofolate cyclodeaminase
MSPTTFQLAGFLDALAAKTPTPGGGAVASAVGATGAALARKVVGYSLGKKSLAAHQPALELAARELDVARALLLRLADEDAAAYSLVSELQKLPETDPRRVAEWPTAVAAAIAAPRATAAACSDLLRLLESLAPITNRQLRSDLTIAAVLAEAGAKAGWWNVQVNLPLLPEADERSAVRTDVELLIRQAADRRARIEAASAA